MDNHFKFTNSVVECRSFLLFLWFVYWLEIRFGFDFDKTGFSRTFTGLQGFFLVLSSIPI
jgi:hypothetical protein